MITAKKLTAARMAKAPYLSKKEFAELAGVDQASICRWEQGKIPKTSGKFHKYLVFLGLSDPIEPTDPTKPTELNITSRLIGRMINGGE